MKNIYLILIGLFATSCATVNSVIEGGKDAESNKYDGRPMIGLPAYFKGA